MHYGDNVGYRVFSDIPMYSQHRPMSAAMSPIVILECQGLGQTSADVGTDVVAGGCYLQH